MYALLWIQITIKYDMCFFADICGFERVDYLVVILHIPLTCLQVAVLFVILYFSKSSLFHLNTLLLYKTEYCRCGCFL